MTTEHSAHASATPHAHALHMARQADAQNEYRKLPAVDALLREPTVAALVAQLGAEPVTRAVRDLLAAARAAIAGGEEAPTPEQWPARIAAALHSQAQPSLRPVINATGVIIHTNLGRAPLSDEARQAMMTAAHTYTNLEYDLAAGRRGSRYDHARALLCELTGAEDALVVNNCASAVYLVLAALCQDREVLISRGELVEIGGGFRIPDVLRQSGARLVEVGTTNRTHARDFAAGITARTAALMRVHASNFRQIGFTTMPPLHELAEIAHAPRAHAAVDDFGPDHKLLLIDDLGSGTLLDTRPYGLQAEPMVQESIAAGADLVTFSGDKLLGGPQAGIILGRAEPMARLRRHPMARALRVDKTTLAALDATLRSYQRGRATTEIPVWRMISATVEDVAHRARAWQRTLQQRQIVSHIWQGESTVGGGSLPGETLPTALLAIDAAALGGGSVDQAAARLREGELPVICRIQQEHLLFDPRTVFPAQESTLLDAITKICTARSETC